jgi:hypothetical protein
MDTDISEEPAASIFRANTVTTSLQSVDILPPNYKVSITEDHNVDM